MSIVLQTSDDFQDGLFSLSVELVFLDLVPHILCDL